MGQQLKDLNAERHRNSKRFATLSVLQVIFFAIVWMGVAGKPANIHAQGIVPQESKTFKIQGMHSAKGPFSGSLSFKSGQSGSPDLVQRVVTYDTFIAYGLKVQEIWQGEAKRDPAGIIELTFSLKRGDYILEVPGAPRRSPQDFREMLVVRSKISGTSAKFELDGATVEESYVPTSESVAWWKSERHRTSAYGTEKNFLVNLAQFLAINRVINWYRNLKELDPYRGTTEFNEQVPHFVTDITDLEFYRNNPGILRVVQKRVDEISLLETYHRYLALAPTLKAKAQSYENDMQFYINELGIYSRSRRSANGTFLGYGPEGDAALWTGMYAATLATKYLVEGDLQTLEKFRKILRGVVTLIEAPGGGEFARHALLLAPGEVPQAPWYAGSGAYSHIKFLAGGNNDMFKGLIYTLTWAQTLVDRVGHKMSTESREELRSTVQQQASNLLGMKLLKKKRPNKAAVYGLLAWSKGDKKAYANFLEQYRNWVYSQKQLDIDGGFYFGAITDWSGINLSIVTESNLVLIAEGLEKRFPELQEPNPDYNGLSIYPDSAREVAFEQRQSLRKMWRTNAVAHRDFLTVATKAFADPDIENDLDFKRTVRRPPIASIKNFADLWNWSKDRWILSLIQFPDKKGGFDFAWDHSQRPDFVMSPWPKLPWKSILKRKPADYHVQGLDSYPAYEGFVYGSSWFWKEIAFEFRGGASRQESLSGGDYLYLYWLARYAGWLDENGEKR